MSEEYSFLTYLINEDIYYIKTAPEEITSPQHKLTKEDSANMAGGDTPPAVENKKVEEKNIEEDNVEKREGGEKVDFTGENLKEILILVNEQQQVLGTEDMAFLQKVLASVGIGMNDVALVNICAITPGQMNNIALIPHRFRFCFMERIPDVLNGPDMVKYNSIMIQEKKVLWCDPLGAISMNKEMKVKLWQQLKIMFLNK